MPSSISRALVALAALVAVAVLGLAAREPRPDPARADRAPAFVSPASVPHLAFASPEPTFGAAVLAGDGGVALSTIDAAIDDPDPATGRLAREITARLCPGASTILCAARRRFGCAPIESWDDEGEPIAAGCAEAVQASCGDWAQRHYATLEDRLVVHERHLARCLEALRTDALDGQALALDYACNELGADPAREGEACDAEWLPCGDDGECFERVCERPAQLGEPCVDARCASELVCVAGLCDRPTPRGGACDDESTCAERGDFCLDGVCAANVPLGGACAADAECAVDARCVLGRCTRTGGHDACTLEGQCGRGRTCVGDFVARCEAPPPEGAACATQGDCDPWLGCVDGHCASFGRPTYGARREGEPCEPVSGGSDCARELVCAYGAEGYRCERGARVGESCEGRICVLDAVCVWRADDGRCEAAVCQQNDYFAEMGEE